MMVKGLYDTNILIDYLNGIDAARKLFAVDPEPAVSLISWMEILIGAADESEDKALRRWLSGFIVVPIDSIIAERAITLRRNNRIRLPDALIWASAEITNRSLVTRNTRDFPEGTPGVYVPYRL